MARHVDHLGNSITCYWRWAKIPTPARLDLHPLVNNREGPPFLVSVAEFLYLHLTRSLYVDASGR